ncbi:DinB family protein [Bacteroidota bacterium]
MVKDSEILGLVQLNVSTLLQLKGVLTALDNDLYTNYDPKGQATIGQHVRHTLEFFECLFEGDGQVNYDARKRSILLETNLTSAVEAIDRINARVELIADDSSLLLVTELPTVSSAPLMVSSSVGRELFYVLEHAIHHMALIRILVKDVRPDFELPASFGVAYSTLAYRASS